MPFFRRRSIPVTQYQPTPDIFPPEGDGGGWEEVGIRPGGGRSWRRTVEHKGRLRGGRVFAAVVLAGVATVTLFSNLAFGNTTSAPKPDCLESTAQSAVQTGTQGEVRVQGVELSKEDVNQIEAVVRNGVAGLASESGDVLDNYSESLRLAMARERTHSDYRLNAENIELHSAVQLQLEHEKAVIANPNLNGQLRQAATAPILISQGLEPGQISVNVGGRHETTAVGTTRTEGALYVSVRKETGICPVVDEDGRPVLDDLGNLDLQQGETESWRIQTTPGTIFKDYRALLSSAAQPANFSSIPGPEVSPVRTGAATGWQPPTTTSTKSVINH